MLQIPLQVRCKLVAIQLQFTYQTFISILLQIRYCFAIDLSVAKFSLQIRIFLVVCLPLGGNISSSLLDQKHLQYLDLSYNDFGSINIPKFFGSLPTLRYLNLSNAGFGGVIPHQLGNLSKLPYLDIGSSYYYDPISLNVEDLESISGFPFLEYLDMTIVNLGKASNWLQVMNKLHSLSVLLLSSCEHLAIDPLPHVNFSSLLILDLPDVGIMAHSLLKWWLTIGMVAHYWNDGYTIEMVAIIFLYKLISSSFVIIPSRTSLSERKRKG